MKPVSSTTIINPTESRILPYGRQWLDEEDIAAVIKILQGNWLTQGPTIPAFEQALAEYCGARYAVAVSHGTAALHIACLAAGVGQGDVGITSPITFVASANCLAYCGGTPIFADIDPVTVTLDPNALAEVCERHPPKVIIPVDFAGQPADMPAIQQIARRYGAVVIEDAAHSLGASYQSDGQTFRVGECAHADMAILSFHPVKHITTGEGGAILTNDETLYRRLLRLRSHGIAKGDDPVSRNDGAWYYEQQELGFNYRITDLQCALGLSQMKKLPAFVERRRELVALYCEQMGDLKDEVQLLIEQPNRRSSYHLLVALFRGGAARRKNLFDYMRAQNIYVQVHYFPVHLQRWYQEQFGYREGDFPHAESYYEQCFSLPLFPAMQNEDVERVIKVMTNALEENPL